MESNPAGALVRIAPVRPAAPYIGGKRVLAKRLVERIAAIPHVTYAEVFVGMGGVFFRRDQRPRAEVINDWSEDVSNFFRILQRHYIAFMDLLRFQLTTRAGFEQLIALEPRSLTDLERAARFLYLQRTTFGGKVAGRTFGVSVASAARFDVTKLGPVLEAIYERLAGVTIERLRWADFIDRYDRPETLLFLDPPYYGCEDDYGHGMFGADEIAQVAERLRLVRGRFILTINDHPDVRRMFEGFEMEAADVRYTIAGANRATNHGELIISN